MIMALNQSLLLTYLLNIT